MPIVKVNSQSRMKVISTYTFATMIFIVLFAGVAFSQIPVQKPSPTPPPRPVDGVFKDDSTPLTTFEEEMKAKREIKIAEKDHEENLSRAREIGEIGKQLKEESKDNSAPDHDCFKKIERLEKSQQVAQGESCFAANVEEFENSFPARVMARALGRSDQIDEVVVENAMKKRLKNAGVLGDPVLEQMHRQFFMLADLSPRFYAITMNCDLAGAKVFGPTPHPEKPRSGVLKDEANNAPFEAHAPHAPRGEATDKQTCSTICRKSLEAFSIG